MRGGEDENCSRGKIEDLMGRSGCGGVGGVVVVVGGGEQRAEGRI